MRTALLYFLFSILAFCSHLFLITQFHGNIVAHPHFAEPVFQNGKTVDISAEKEVTVVVSAPFSKKMFFSVFKNEFSSVLSGYMSCPLKCLINNSFVFQSDYLSHHFLLI